jgi:primosomal protein N' (replication factor Y)
MYAEIAVNAPVDNTFDYEIPPELEGKLFPGHLVQVPFGAALQHGIVLRVHDETPERATKSIAARLDPQPALSEAQIDLARWMSATYLSPLGPALWLFMPPGLTGGRDIVVTLLDDNPETEDELETEIVALLARRGPLRGAQMNQALPGKPWRAAVDAMEKAGIVDKEGILTAPRAKPKVARIVSLAVPEDEIEPTLQLMATKSARADLLEEVARANGAVFQTKQNRATAVRLAEAGLIRISNQAYSLAIPRSEVESHLDEMRRLTKARRIVRVIAQAGGTMDVGEAAEQADVSIGDLRKLQNEGVLVLGEENLWRDSLADRDFVPATPPPLTAEQRAAWEAVSAAILKRGSTPPLKRGMQPPAPNTAEWCFLLHGVTGSGKTEIYLRAIDQTLEMGRSAILLVPEIALTPQTIRRVASRFAGRVAIVHSGLTMGERYDTWRRARDGMIQVVVGARSALFTPMKDLGLVVMDEEHDHSYKQAESGIGFPGPYYHTRQVAEELMRRRNGVLIMGSATPDLETSFRAQRGDFQRLHMPSRIMGHRTRIQEQAARAGVATRYSAGSTEDTLTIDLPPVQLVDMRRELKSGNTSIFSRALQASLKTVLDRGEQAILFINRRGQSTYVFCRDCGYVATCPNCATPLTHHRQGQSLRCHRCGFEQPAPMVCPQCKSPRIKFFGAGTQHVEQTLHEMFPKARSVRWDADTASSPDDHEAILQRFIERKADVIIGTQMVAKGLDLPLVTLVGVVSADLGLALPDFRAGERTFQTLTQVAGRAGRGVLGGQVVLQTYQPEHYVIQAAARHDYETFYQKEIRYRRELGYPPFRRFVRIIFRTPNEERTQKEAERAAQILRKQIKDRQLTGTDLIGPAPCFFTKVNRFYRWHLLLRGPNPKAALDGMDLPKGWFIDVDPVDVL